MTRHGFPTAIELAGISFVTTLPEPMTQLSPIITTGLTTVFQPLFDMGAVSIRALIKLINGEPVEEKKIELPYQIMERESVIKK